MFIEFGYKFSDKIGGTKYDTKNNYRIRTSTRIL